MADGMAAFKQLRRLRQPEESDHINVLGVQAVSKPRKIHLLHTHTYVTLVGLRTYSTIPHTFVRSRFLAV